MATSILPGTTRSGGHSRTYKLGAGLRMRGATSGRVGILPPATITSYDLTLPAALGASDKLLQVSSAGVVSLVDPVTIGGTGTELLYRGGASSAAAVAGSSWNGTTLTLPGTVKVYANGNSILTIENDNTNNVVTINASGRIKHAYNVTDSRYEIYSNGTDASLPGDRGAIRLGGVYLSGGGASSDGYFGVFTGGVTTPRFAVSWAGQSYFGNGITSATPAAGYLYGTGGSGTNIVGGSLYIAPGPSTGNATPSAVILQSTVAGVSGSTAQTLSNTVMVSGGNVTVGARGAANGVVYANEFRETGGGSDYLRFTSVNNPVLHGYTTLSLAVRSSSFLVATQGTSLVITPPGGTMTVAGHISLADAKNLAVDTTTGTKLGTATSQKLALWNATPIVQPTTAFAEAAFTENAGGTAVNDDSTFDGYTLRQVVAAMRAFGLLA